MGDWFHFVFTCCTHHLRTSTGVRFFKSFSMDDWFCSLPWPPQTKNILFHKLPEWLYTYYIRTYVHTHLVYSVRFFKSFSVGDWFHLFDSVLVFLSSPTTSCLSTFKWPPWLCNNFPVWLVGGRAIAWVWNSIIIMLLYYNIAILNGYICTCVCVYVRMCVCALREYMCDFCG